jgi:hypothetical protein
MPVTTSTPQPFAQGQRLVDNDTLTAWLAKGPPTSTSAGLTATGTTAATGFQLQTSISQFTTVGANTGVTIPAEIVPGQHFDVYHNGVSALKVYALGGATIDGTAGATGVALTAASRCRYTCVAPGVILSSLLGAVSS